jgi:tRNA threonylcarbamoyladenosine biosynthesis protein TsaB
VLLLGIETATDQVGCAVGDQNGLSAQFHATRPRRHAESLAPAIEFVTAQAGIGLQDVAAVAVDVGPGLFTGLRVGVATAKALAQALRIPVVGIPSLDLLAFPVRHASRLVATAVDARRGQIFYAFYRHAPGGAQRLSGFELGSPADLASELLASGEECLVVGEGALRHRDELSGLGRVELGSASHGYPSAAALVELAGARALREEFVQASELEPLYLRKADAEVGWSGPAAASLTARPEGTREAG